MTITARTAPPPSATDATDATDQPSRGLASRHDLQTLGRFVVIGLASTLAYVALFVALRGATTAPVANLLALALTVVGNTAANRRFTFGVHGRAGLVGDHAAGLASLAVALALTTSAIATLQFIAPGAGRTVEIVVLVLANAVATITRFTMLRAWLGRMDRRPTAVAVPVMTDRRGVSR